MIDTGMKDKVALITGGNNPYGIGAAIARAFASEQASWITGQKIYVGGGHNM